MALIDTDKIITDTDLIDFLLDRHKETGDGMFLAAANSISLYRRDINLLNFCTNQSNTWISVKDRLPTWQDGKVLVFTAYGVSVCERTVNGRWQGKHANWITHWMQLPAPPVK